MSAFIITNSSSELFIPSHELANASASPVSSPPTPPQKMIPLKILPRSVPQVITTTKTLRRCCGFSLAICGFIFYCLRALLALWWIGLYLFFREAGSSGKYSAMTLILEAAACSVGITKFLRIMSNPKLTLKESNLKNVWMFALIPILSLSKCLFASRPSSYILPIAEFIFYSGYIYSLSLNGRSSSMWAGFKPYKYAMVPLILPVPPSSRAFPQYTIPPTAKISV